MKGDEEYLLDGAVVWHEKDNMYIVATYPDSTAQRPKGISAKPVVDFLIAGMHEHTLQTTILSPQGIESDEVRWASASHRQEESNILYPPSLGGRNKVAKIINMGLSWMWLFALLGRNTKRGETILVYHSMNYLIPISLLRHFKKLRVVLYIGEFYQTLYPMSPIKRRMETRYIKRADAYVFVTHLLIEQVKALRKDSFDHVTLYGPYMREILSHQDIESIIIRLLYVGKISKDKGIERTIELANYLNDQFEIRIIGYCESYDEEILMSKISESNRTNTCKIIFDGVKHGAEYTEYVQSCELGLVLQNMDASFNANSFPSKILSFISNGLEVLAPNIPTIATSPFASSLYLYHDESAQEIAKIVKGIDFSQRRCHPQILDALKTEFYKDFGALITSAR